MLLVSDVIQLPTTFGDFQVSAFGEPGDRDHLLLQYGRPAEVAAPLVRIHSECITSEVFGSLKCDCRQQLMQAIGFIRQEKAGIILYLRQEGRGIGLFNKINTYRRQELGADTIDANLQLGFGIDQRDYSLAVQMLQRLQITTARLITNNPDKVAQVTAGGIRVTATIPTSPVLNRFNQPYIETKISRLHHQYAQYVRP